MLIALLVVLGVDVIVIVIFLVAVIGRRRWLKRQPGEFLGAIRVTVGEVDGLGPKWKRGSGRWVRDILVWSRAPFLYRNLVLAVDGSPGERSAAPGEVKRLGDRPVILTAACGQATIEIATAADHRDRLRALLINGTSSHGGTRT